MFELLIFIALIGAAGTVMRRMFKKQREEHEKRMAFLKENWEFQKRMLDSMKNPVAATAVGGAATLFLLDQLINNNDLDQQTIAQMQDMDLQQLQHFAIENNFMEQEEINQLMDEFDPFDPYTNPGTDLVVDEYYHGIDHGLDNDHFNDSFHHHDFGGGFDNFGGGCGSDF